MAYMQPLIKPAHQLHQTLMKSQNQSCSPEDSPATSECDA